MKSEEWEVFSRPSSVVRLLYKFLTLFHIIPGCCDLPQCQVMTCLLGAEREVELRLAERPNGDPLRPRIRPCVTSSRPGGWHLHKAMSGQQQDGPALARLGFQRAAAKISLFFKPPVKASAEPSPAAELSVTREPSLSWLPHPAQPALTGSPGSPSSTPLAGEPEPCPQVESRLHRGS